MNAPRYVVARRTTNGEFICYMRKPHARDSEWGIFYDSHEEALRIAKMLSANGDGFIYAVETR